MFSSLTNSFSNILKKIRSISTIKDGDLDNVLREIRVVLIEADVSLSVIKDFIEKVREKALGQEIMKSLTAGQTIIKIIQEELINILNLKEGENLLNIQHAPPVNLMLVGLQGSGKTTSAGKLALYLQKQKKRILLVSLDTYRPAAQEQLFVIAASINVDVLEIVPGQKPLDIALRAREKAASGLYDVVIYDTAGRLHIDDEMMDELQKVKNIISPHEVIFVADSMTGQDAVNIADNFNKNIGFDSVILTRVDGDARGGAALSVKYVTGKPIKFLGTGEKLSGFEEFHVERIVSRILDMGDVLSLIEKAKEAIKEDETEKLMKKIEQGKFDLADFLVYIRSINKIGGMGNILSFLPGASQFQENLDMDLYNSSMQKTEAIILSMTPRERRYPAIINGSRKKRIANGSGVTINDVNKLLKQHQKMEKMMKKISSFNPSSLIKGKLSKYFS